MAQIFNLEWVPEGDNLAATVDLPNGPVKVLVGCIKDKIQPAPGAEWIEVTRWGFALLRDGRRLSSGQGTNIEQAAIFRTAYKAVLRVASMEALVDKCPSCNEHRYPLQDQTKPSKGSDKDDRVVCPACKNNMAKRGDCKACFTIGYLYRPDAVKTLRCINKSCASRKPTPAG